MESEKKSLTKMKVIYAGLLLLTGAAVCGFSFVLGKSYEAILRNTIVSIIMSGTINFMLLDAIFRGREGFSFVIIYFIYILGLFLKL